MIIQLVKEKKKVGRKERNKLSPNSLANNSSGVGTKNSE